VTSFLRGRSKQWWWTVGGIAAIAVLIFLFRTGRGLLIDYAEAGRPVNVSQTVDATPGGTPVNDQSTATTGVPCRNPFGVEGFPFELTADAERMIGADPTGTMTDPCAAQDLAFALLAAVPPESAGAAGKVCAARLWTVPAPDGQPGGQLELTFDAGKGTPLVDCTAAGQGQVQVPEGGRLPTVTTVGG
jgi:hypothetical protein